ncbi:MAG: OsmC family protein [Chthonomonadales bacterium]
MTTNTFDNVTKPPRNVITFSAQASWRGEGVGVDVTARGHRLSADEPAELGGRDIGPNPVELVLAGLGSCLTVLAALFAPKHGVDLQAFAVDVEGDLDPAGFQELADVRPGFLRIRYRIRVGSPSPRDRVEALLEHIQRVCPVKDTLTGVPIEYGGAEHVPTAA